MDDNFCVSENQNLQRTVKTSEEDEEVYSEDVEYELYAGIGIGSLLGIIIIVLVNLQFI